MSESTTNKLENVEAPANKRNTSDKATQVSRIDKTRLGILMRHMVISSIRIEEDPPIDARTAYPLSELEQRSHGIFSTIQVCRGVVKSLNHLHASGVMFNGNIAMQSTYLRELGGRKFRIQFNIRKDDEWYLQDGARFASQEKFEDIESVGFVLLELLKNPITDRSSQESGELSWMRSLAEWMVDPTPSFRPFAEWCCKHHAMWKSHKKIVFVQALNVFIMNNKKDNNA